jgi:hypothetical protein
MFLARASTTCVFFTSSSVSIVNTYRLNFKAIAKTPKNNHKYQNLKNKQIKNFHRNVIFLFAEAFHQTVATPENQSC